MRPDFIEAFAQSVSALVSYVDRDEVVRFVTRGYEEWFGTPRASIVGRSLRELYGAEAYAQFAPSVKRALAGEEVHYERQALDATGRSWSSHTVSTHVPAAE